MIPARMQKQRSRFARAVRRKPGEMNGLEKEYSRMLEMQRVAGSIQEYFFESLKLKLAPKTFYEPDFFVVAGDGVLEIHEVKGHWEDDARVKIKVAAALFPFRFKAITWDRKARQWVEENFVKEETQPKENE